MSETQAKAQRDRSVEAMVSHALGHQFRIEILAALNERSYTKTGLASVIGQTLSIVEYHVDALEKAGAIELARSEPVGNRNISQHFYRAISTPYFSDEVMEEKTFEERQEIYALILQASMAEGLASLWAGSISSDPRAWLTWDRIDVDEVGREEIADEQAASWERLEEIKSRAANRRAASTETTPMIVASFGYQRSRSSPQLPMPPGEA